MAVADARRQRGLWHLARDLWDLRPAIISVQHELRWLVARGRVRPLSREEATRVGVLRREHAALGRRLRAYAAAYERLRPGPERHATCTDLTAPPSPTPRGDPPDA